MTNDDAKKLLGRIKQAKQSKEAEGFTDWLFSSPTPQTDAAFKNKANQDAMRTLSRALILSAGGGAAVRGLIGLGNLMTADAEPVPTRTVDMPVSYLEKKKQKKQAFDKYDVPYFLPGMILGAPLAAYGGWKGVDAVLDKQRRGKTDDELNDAKEQYEEALLNSYKHATDDISSDDLLDDVFTTYSEKKAGNWMNFLKGLGITYALGAAPIGYAVVDSAMKKSSKRKLLEKAMRERARRQAARQPAELYAIPQPVSADDTVEG